MKNFELIRSRRKTLALLLQAGLYPGFMTGYEGVDPGLG